MSRSLALQTKAYICSCCCLPLLNYSTILPPASVIRIPYPTLNHSNLPPHASLIRTFLLPLDCSNTLPDVRLLYSFLRLIIRIVLLPLDYSCLPRRLTIEIVLSPLDYLNLSNRPPAPLNYLNCPPIGLLESSPQIFPFSTCLLKYFSLPLDLFGILSPDPRLFEHYFLPPDPLDTLPVYLIIKLLPPNNKTPLCRPASPKTT